MSESIDEVKKRITHKYLGKAGIHGVGIRRSHNAICVYIDGNSSPEQEMLLEELEKEAAPFKVLTIKEERPTILRQDGVEEM